MKDLLVKYATTYCDKIQSVARPNEKWQLISASHEAILVKFFSGLSVEPHHERFEKISLRR
jgi:hypothetical protein